MKTKESTRRKALSTRVWLAWDEYPAPVSYSRSYNARILKPSSRREKCSPWFPQATLRPQNIPSRVPAGSQSAERLLPRPTGTVQRQPR